MNEDDLALLKQSALVSEGDSSVRQNLMRIFGNANDQRTDEASVSLPTAPPPLPPLAPPPLAPPLPPPLPRPIGPRRKAETPQPSDAKLEAVHDMLSTLMSRFEDLESKLRTNSVFLPAGPGSTSSISNFDSSPPQSPSTLSETNHFKTRRHSKRRRTSRSKSLNNVSESVSVFDLERGMRFQRER